MRKVPALIASAGLLIALAGCAPSGSQSANGCEAAASGGAASALVTVDGDFGSMPAVSFPTPVTTATTQVEQVIAGEGAGLQTGQKAQIDMTVYNARSGEQIEQTSYDGTNPTALVVGDSLIEGLRAGLLCATQGSRVAIVVPPKDAFGPEGNPSIGVEPDDSLIFVVDVEKLYMVRAAGAAQPQQNGFPAVVLAPDGRPGITVPPTNAPSELMITPTIIGNGPKVKEGDSITVNYTGVVWDTNEVFDSSWERGEPASFLAADGSTVQGGVIPGFAEALVGARVGSQIIAVIPPELAYGEAGSGAVPANSTLVFVVDILGID